ncbi:ParB/RepB/Spo0J family partition protein [Corynebacterium freneyi]|nr:ParB/RepB/Spo0J family partition protein [Corynebacterium freneyi]MCG7439806.1 ParB/RepB/Spo0J family partition protein [Corynebacterium freneyi]QXA52135.1 ParB/RepB/Spo0J family partition protein [Corynebacterium freneyi]WJZ06497.1 putative chromosome-partitioning protein ParB [Corynebacterium freneyi]
MAQDKKDSRRGGLGRGLAALIPTAPEQNPAVGDNAADIIFGPKSRRPDSSGLAQADRIAGRNTMRRDSSQKRHSDEYGSTGGSPMKRHSDETANRRQASADVSRETQGSVRGETSGTAGGSGPEGSEQAVEAGVGYRSSDIGASYREIPIPLIVPNPRQPREVFDEEPLRELAHSIGEFGLMQPIVVRPIGDDVRAKTLEEARAKDPKAEQPEFEIIMGERRWRASQLAGLDAIPAIVRETSDSSMLRDALLENIHRVQLNPLEEAAAYQQLLEEFDVTQAELADRIGRSRPAITNMIRLLQLPVDVQRRVAAGVLTAGHARALLGIKTGTADQSMLADRIIAEGLSVRATEEAVTLINRGEDAGIRRKREPLPQPEKLTTWADRLSDTFDTKVSATMGKRKGRIVIEFGDLADFDRIMSLIGDPGEDQ